MECLASEDVESMHREVLLLDILLLEADSGSVIVLEVIKLFWRLSCLLELDHVEPLAETLVLRLLIFCRELLLVSELHVELLVAIEQDSHLLQEPSHLLQRCDADVLYRSILLERER